MKFKISIIYVFLVFYRREMYFILTKRGLVINIYQPNFRLFISLPNYSTTRMERRRGGGGDGKIAKLGEGEETMYI